MRKTTLMVSLLFTLQNVWAQTGASTNRDARREDWQKYSAQIAAFKTIARSKYSDEQARQKSGDCPKAMTTYDIEMCLGAELEKTGGNYKGYTDALRSIEALQTPDETSAPGPTGTALTSTERTKEFDSVESAWQAYQKAQCAAAYDAYKGGTIAPVMQVTCELRLFRDHMTELESIYAVTENR